MKLDPEALKDIPISRTGLFVIAGVIGIAAVFAGCAGFDIGDLVKARTPLSIQKAEGLPKSMSLNQAEVEYQLWYQKTQQAATQWKADIDRADEIAGLMGQIALQGLNQAGPAVAGLPMGGLAIVGLVGLTGLLIRKPGDVPAKTVEQIRTEHAQDIKRVADATWEEATAAALAKATGAP